MQTAAWVAVAVVVVPAFLSRWPLTADLALPTLAVMAAVAMGAAAFEVEARARILGRDVQQVISFNEAVLVLLLLSVPPAWAWLLTLGANTIVQAVRRPNPLRVTFNLAAWSVSLAAGIAVYGWLSPAGAEGLDLQRVAAVAAGVVVHLCINVTAVTAVVVANTGGRFGRGLATTAMLAVFELSGTLALGLAAAAVWQAQPWLLPVVGILGLLVLHGFRQSIALEGVVEEAGVQRARLEEVVAATEQALIVVDADGHVSLWNAAAETMTGIDADEALGRDVDEVLAGALRDDDGPILLSEPPDDDGSGRSSGWLAERDGPRRRVDVRRATQRDLLGRRLAEIVQIRDQTARYELDRLQDDFLSRVSHELRTPLTTIIGFARTLHDHRGRITPEQVTQFERGILVRSEELTRLVDDLLRIARSDFGSGRPSTAVRLANAARASVDRTRHQWPEHQIMVHQDGDPLLDVDPEVLETIFDQLLSNACKFSATGTTVDVRVGVAPDGTAVVAIADQGRGIPRSRWDEVFDRFTRTEDPMLMETRGAGIGLHTVRRLVESLGGVVSVDSTPGVGSTFTVEIPLSRPGAGRNG